MEWVNSYIGIPWLDNGRTREGCDCYGLVRLVLAEQFQVILDRHDQFYTIVADSIPEITERFLASKEDPRWRPLDESEVYQPGDVLLYLINADRWHCAVYVGETLMLHVRQGCNAIVDRMDSMMWRNRFEGAHRYVGG